MNDLEKIENNLPATPQAASPTTFVGVPNSVQVQNNNGTINNNINNSIINPDILQKMYGLLERIDQNTTPAAQPVKESHLAEWGTLDKSRYCLFVLENENYATGSFSIPKKKALKYTDDFTKDNLFKLTPADIEMIKTMPCIFAIRNMDYKKTDESFPSMVGRITDICIQGDNIKFSFQSYQPAFQQRLLNENLQELKLKESYCRNQLDEEHWAVVECNLIEACFKLGIKVD